VVLPSSGDEVIHGPDDGDSKNVWNVGKFLPYYTVLRPRRQPFSLCCTLRHKLSTMDTGSLIFTSQLLTWYIGGDNTAGRWNRMTCTSFVSRTHNWQVSHPILETCLLKAFRYWCTGDRHPLRTANKQYLRYERWKKLYNAEVLITYLFFTEYYKGDQIVDKEIIQPCSAHG
jgi:hypothetical protein